jgi:hypothetical protein
MKHRYHQATLRTGGPTHALRHISRESGYADRAACGIPVGPLAQTKGRTFTPDDASCKRCVVSVGKQS